MKRRVFSLLSAFIAVLTLMPVTAFADGQAGGTSLTDWIYTLNNNDCTVTLNRYTGSSVNVIVPGSFDYQGQTYTAVLSCSSVFSGSSIQSVKICSGAGFSGNSMRQLFIGCTALSDADLSEADTSEITDISYLFSNCSALTSFDFSSVDTSGVNNMSYMFYGCSALAEVSFSGTQFSNVENMSYMFYGCNALDSFDFSGTDISSVSDMSYMFCSCRTLTDINFAGTDTPSLNNISGMFSACSALTELDLSSLDTGAVTSMGSLLSGCTALTSVNFSGLDTSNVTDMSNMFYSCSSLQTLDLSPLNTASVTTISSMFDSCTALSGLTGYENWNTSSLQNMSFAFNKTANAVSASTHVCIDLSRWDLSNITNSGWCFQNCLAQQIILPDNIAVISAGFMNHAVRYTGSYYTIPSGVTRIGYAHTFYDFATDSFTEFRVAQGNTAYKAVDGVLYSADSKEMLAVPRNKPFENGVFEIL
ncbi:MAG: BspA family leucine-rich repeat surface protein, partial [Clostridia bacterium]|nr:BspA family leucine-rich repeat surface protein [Clostridia bacterium]